jgi:hypothetical protein
VDGDGDGGSQDWQGGDDDGELILRDGKRCRAVERKKDPWFAVGMGAGLVQTATIGADWLERGGGVYRRGGWVRREACARRRSVERLRRDQRSSKALDRWEASVANGGQWGGCAGTRMGRERNECGVEEE